MNTPKTSISADQPYATPGDYLARVDVRLTGDLARDDGSQATPTELLAEPRLAAALAGASGSLEAAVLVSGRYNVEDLQAATGNSLALLKDIVCGLAVQRMRWARGIMEESTYPLYKQALLWLEALHEGKAILAFSEVVAAGLPSTYQMQTTDFFYGTPSLLTNNARSWGIRKDRQGGFPSYGAF